MWKQISVLPSAFLYLACLLLILPVQWIGAMIAAAMCHELGHLAALKLLHIPVSGIRIGMVGTVIETGAMLPRHEICCALSGPLAGVVVAAAARSAPMLFLCALGQTAFNLLPLPGADGGRVLRCLLHRVIQKRKSFS